MLAPNIEITASEFIVKLGWRTNNPQLLNVRYDDRIEPVPWLGSSQLAILFA